MGKNRMGGYEDKIGDARDRSYESFYDLVKPVENYGFKMNKSDYIFQLCAYHGFMRSELAGNTLRELKSLYEDVR